jgi:hypothetical protein
MSADSQSTRGASSSPTVKIFRGKSYIVGYAGTETAGQKFVSWLKNKDNDKPIVSDFEALVLHFDGKIEYWDDNMFPIPVHADYYAIGSGADFASGALFLGHSTEEAVKAAREHDVYTGGRIRTYKIPMIYSGENPEKE